METIEALRKGKDTMRYRRGRERERSGIIYHFKSNSSSAAASAAAQTVLSFAITTKRNEEELSGLIMISEIMENGSAREGDDS